MTPSGLKLLAEDAEGLGIIASAVQDALVKPEDMRLDARSRTFGLELNRFQWEAAGNPVHAVRGDIGGDVYRTR